MIFKSMAIILFTISLFSMTACQDWSWSSNSRNPRDHTNRINYAYHVSEGINQPHISCNDCHGQKNCVYAYDSSKGCLDGGKLQADGTKAPSCYLCHGAVWD